MALAHHIGYAENTSTGKPLKDTVIRVYSSVGNVLQPVFADTAGTPKPVVSSDDNGAYDFYIEDGNYDIEHVYGGVVRNRISRVPIFNPDNYKETADFGTFGATFAANETAADALIDLGLSDALGDVIYVKDYIVGDNSVDDTTGLNAAFTAASGKVIEFPANTSIKVNGQIIIRGDATKIRGNGATINSYFAGEAVTFAAIGGTRYPYNISAEDLSINAYGVGGHAFMVKTSYSTYKRISVAMPAINVGGRGFVIPGDDTYGTGPYYNTFINCDAQSGSAGADHIGFSLSAAAPNNRAPNANTFIGCRAGQCLKNFVIKGNGNGFYNPISEGAGAGSGIAFSFEGDTAINCIENYIFGAYIEGVPTAYSFNANSGSNFVFGGFTTGITTFINDLGTGNYYLTDLAPWKTPTGLKFAATSSDANTLDYYAEGAWTPVPTGVTVNSGTPVWEGTYTRVGNIVTAHIKMSGGNITTVAGTSRVTLPFTASQIEWGTFGNSGTTVLGGGVAAYGVDLYFAAALTASAVTASITFRV